MSLISWISSAKLPWAAWGIQFSVALSLACKIVLAILGSHRKYVTWIPAYFITWATYLLLSYFATIALGKLTVVRIDDPENPGYDVMLQGLLATLLLMHLGYADGMTAYAVEDNRLGLRQMLKIGVTVCVVGGILYRCWDSSSPVWTLYIPLLMVAIIKSVEWVWALQAVSNENLSVTAEDMSKAVGIKQAFGAFPKDEKFAHAKDILKAYHRFHCLKPHLKNWLYHPQFISHESMSIEDYPTGRAFTVTEIELNFIMYITCTYALLMAVTTLELYQILMLPFSDWAVAKMSMEREMPLVRRLLPFLANRCMKKKRWSRSVGQLNLLDHQLYKECPKPIATLLLWLEKREIIRWLHSRPAMPSSLKALVVQKIRELDKKRDLQPFTKRGEWTLEAHGIQEKKGLSDSIATEFDKSIIIWHIATEILHKLESENSTACLGSENFTACMGSKHLSDYMIYLLILRTYMLSLPDADIMLEYACCTLRPFLRDKDLKELISTLSSPDRDVPGPVKLNTPKWITCDWNVLLKVQKLVVDLRTMDNKWELISSIWVEMLCYAAFKCRVYHHEMLLSKGGELITHMWLLVAHKTDNHQLRNDELSEDPATPIESPSPGKAPSSCFKRMFRKKFDQGDGARFGTGQRGSRPPLPMWSFLNICFIFNIAQATIAIA
ncbi:hypothetical protein BT93_L1774 [Corymbia citriodora subsp. variegata]|uniref:DUF4220 domain-containing protein n=1 Tax=Corymbia citriodora subsp. variegata TaxID=360336 RepID=A0A8T0CLS3_CORYI|nr:hypothetical protein BT93_L1774 [Corymbia citriodora subsp. variegata]